MIRRWRGIDDRFLLLGLLAVFALAVTTLPSVDDVDTAASRGPSPSAGSVGAPSAEPGSVAGPSAEPGAAGGRGGTVTTPGTADSAPGPGGAGATGQVAGCDRAEQVPGDPYSPPCVTFAGDNGGATAKGVTATEVLVAMRVLDEPGFQDALAQVAGAEITDSAEDIRRTLEGLVEYFNTRFEFYGRSLRLVFYDGKGSTTNELLGGGQEEAGSDAIKVAEEIGAFADLSAYTAPYADALARRGVIAFNAPYMSREWYRDRRPYAWSITTDCSIIAETVTEYAHKRLLDHPARWAGGELEGKPRKVAIIAPENPWYQQCVDAGMTKLQQLGRQGVTRVAYKLELSSMSNQAAGIVARLRDQDITSVLYAGDPIFPVFLTDKARQQSWQPEWILAGTAFTDIDLLGQLYDQDQWSRAFGVSYLGPLQPLRASYGYNAYKQVRDDEPATSVDLLYYAMYMLAIGVQGAGPQLTPQTYEQGMFDYPGGTGIAGTWGFGPQNYTPTQDAREIWWDPDRTSVQNNQPGAYVDPHPGVRYRRGEWPTGAPNVFES